MSKPTIMDKARATIVLDHPFFATVLLKHPMEAKPNLHTLAAINGVTGKIIYNPEEVEKLTVKQCVYLLCHEILHYVGLDSLRVGTRDKKGWNVAADEWINDTLDKLQIGERPPGGVCKPGASETTREQLYDLLKKDNGGGGPPDPLRDDIEYGQAPVTESEQHEIEAQVKLELAEAAQVAKMKGKLPGILQKFVEDAIASKVPWYDVLERFMTEHVKTDQSWARPNRRYAPDYYMPTLDNIGAMGELAVQVDISGSVSREEIRYYNGHLKRIVEMCRPAKVHVIYTDTQVQKHDVFDRPEDMEVQYHSGGGTDMVEGLRYLEREGIEPAVLVTLTDGYTDFPEQGEFAVPQVWCISSDKVSPVGETIHFDMED